MLSQTIKLPVDRPRIPETYLSNNGFTYVGKADRFGATIYIYKDAEGQDWQLAAWHQEGPEAGPEVNVYLTEITAFNKLHTFKSDESISNPATE